MKKILIILLPLFFIACNRENIYICETVYRCAPYYNTCYSEKETIKLTEEEMKKYEIDNTEYYPGTDLWIKQTKCE